jgi:preprotein translocase subunit SecF
MISSILSIIFFGLKPGIDFTGGSILEVEYLKERPSIEAISEKLSGLDLGSFYIQPTGEKGIIIKMKSISEDVHSQIISRLGNDDNKIEEKRFESIGPIIGKELKEKTNIVILLSLIIMMTYIVIAFRNMRHPLKSWQCGISTIITLLHDILIPLGVFAVLGRFYGVEVSIPVVTALIIIVGYAINNTIVVFDRIRENFFKTSGTFEEIVDKSLNQTLLRQLSTSFTTLLTVLSIFLFGGETLKYFSLTLILGIISGVYSSFFISAPLLVLWLKWKKRLV